jgi:hypothetical protein
MGLGTRISIVKEDDSLQHLSQKRYNRLIKGHPDEGLVKYAGKRIHYVLIVLEMINRKPIEIIMTEYSFLKIQPLNSFLNSCHKIPENL